MPLKKTETYFIGHDEKGYQVYQCEICGEYLPWHLICQEADYCEYYWNNPEEETE